MAGYQKVSIVVVVFLSIVLKTNAIRCFYCNSANNSACLDVTSFEDDEKFRIIPTVMCETAIPSPVAVDFFCRKIVQTIYHSHRDSEVRVTRGCGWIWHDKPCYQTSNRDHQEVVCGCASDFCNHAEGSDPTFSTIMFLALATCLYFY